MVRFGLIVLLLLVMVFEVDIVVVNNKMIVRFSGRNVFGLSSIDLCLLGLLLDKSGVSFYGMMKVVLSVGNMVIIVSVIFVIR